MKLSFYSKLSQNEISNFKFLYFGAKKFLIFKVRLAIDLYIGLINGTNINQITPFIYNGKCIDSTYIGYSIKIGNMVYSSDKSSVFEYIRVIDYPETNNFISTFDYISLGKVVKVNKIVKLPYYLSLERKDSVGDDISNKLKNVEGNIESYTRDEIEGVIESILNQ